MEWISVSPELRKAVLATKSRQEGDIVVVNFDKAAVVKRCTDPAGTGAVPWLLDIPGKGAVYAQQTGQALIHTMALDAAIPCDHSFAALDPVDAKYVVASGQGGVSGVGGADWMQVGLSKEGAIARAFAQGVLVYFDYQVPPSMLADLKERASMVIANNRRLFAVSAIDFDNPSSYRLLILRKSDNTWRRMPDVGESVDCERAFGEFIAEVAAIRRGSPAAVESAGRSDWRKEWTSTGPNMAAVFDSSRFIFPGRLYLYDVATERLYTIATNQGDSEILLVEDGVVYYRVSDRLYSATITGKDLSPGHLLATSDV